MRGRVDGRVRRGERNRDAIAQAYLDCIEAGDVQPSAAAIAERARVSVRTVHNHFDDMEALFAAAARRRWEELAPTAPPLPSPDLPLARRVEWVVQHRADFFERIAPVRRAALLWVHRSPEIASNFAQIDRELRGRLQYLFGAELEQGGMDLLDAIDALTSWDMWNRLRNGQGCSPVRARRVVVSLILARIGESDGSGPAAIRSGTGLGSATSRTPR